MSDDQGERYDDFLSEFGRKEYERLRLTHKAVQRRWPLEYFKQGLPLPAYMLWQLVAMTWRYVLPTWAVVALFRGTLFV